MCLYEELKHYEKPDFIVVERELSDDPNIQQKMDFSVEDRFVDYSLETQQEQGGILVPVFHSEHMNVSRPTKLLNYEATPLGCGVWKLTTSVGTRRLNENDTYYTKEHLKKRDRHFVYRGELNGFVFLEDEEMIRKALEPFEELRRREDILNVLHTFEDVMYPKIRRDKLELTQEQIKAIKLYHYILYVVFNKLSKRNYELISNSLAHFHELEPYHKDTLFDRSIWVEEDGTLYPSIGEVQLSKQPSDLFRTRREKQLLQMFVQTKRERNDTVLIPLTNPTFLNQFNLFKTSKSRSEGMKHDEL